MIETDTVTLLRTISGVEMKQLIDSEPSAGTWRPSSEELGASSDATRRLQRYDTADLREDNATSPATSKKRRKRMSETTGGQIVTVSQKTIRKSVAVPFPD